MQRVALIGLGVMGAGMGVNLLKAGFPLTVYNRTRERALALQSAGAHLATSPHEAAGRADVIISMVADDAASRAVWLGENGALSGAKPGCVFIECSTLSPIWIQELGAEAVKHECALLDAPVTGSKEQAEKGQLLFLVGGEKEALEKGRAVLSAMSRDMMHLGPSGSGALMKLINNLVCGVQVAVLAEALALIERAGMDRERALGVLYNGAPGSPLVKALGPRMVARDYDVRFALRLMEKDLRYAIAEAERQGSPLETVETARKIFQRAVDKGFGGKDYAAVSEPLRVARPQ